jgi:20S proteasome subunit beta 1
MTIGGSGSSYIYGYCDANFRENMSKEEAKEFVAKCKRDPFL